MSASSGQGQSGSEHSVGSSIDLRELMRNQFATVSVITARDPEIGMVGMTCSSLVSVCLNPPTVLISLRASTFTSRAVTRTGVFAVNMLAANGELLARTFSRYRDDQFQLARYSDSPEGLPWFDDGVSANLECHVTRQDQVGDHVVSLAAVLHTRRFDDSSLVYGRNDYWTGGPVPPEDAQMSLRPVGGDGLISGIGAPTYQTGPDDRGVAHHA